MKKLFYHTPTKNKNIVEIPNLLSKKNCKYLTSFLKNNGNFEIDTSLVTLPWFVGNCFHINDLEEVEIKNIAHKASKDVATFLSNYKGVEVFPHLVDLVLWNQGQLMLPHSDDGDDHLKMRDYTSIIYLNDDFVGGETMVKVNDFEVYINQPKMGSCIIFKSSDENMHAVGEILTGYRCVISSWFTTDPNHAFVA